MTIGKTNNKDYASASETPSSDRIKFSDHSSYLEFRERYSALLVFATGEYNGNFTVCGEAAEHAFSKLRNIGYKQDDGVISELIREALEFLSVHKSTTEKARSEISKLLTEPETLNKFINDETEQFQLTIKNYEYLLSVL